jgi:hypothetical protein
MRPSPDISIPIFILSRDRSRYLNHNLSTLYSEVKTPFVPIIIDLGSSWPDMLKTLHTHEENGIRVIYKSSADSRTDWALMIREAIAEVMPSVESDVYAITDSDVSFEQVPGNILFFLAELLRNLPEIPAVSPLTHFLPQAQTPLAKNINQHNKFVNWQTQPLSVSHNDILFHVLPAPCHKTLTLYRRDFDFPESAVSGVRTCAPYMVHNQQWKQQWGQATAEDIYYLKHCRDDLCLWSSRIKELSEVKIGMNRV